MVTQRQKKLRQLMSEKSLDGILVSNFYNVLYLTDFKTLTTNEREAFVLVTKKNTFLFTDERYIDRNSLQHESFTARLIEPGKGLLYHLEELIKNEGIKTLGFESEDLRHFEFSAISTRLIGTQCIPVSHFVMNIREIKDDDEIKKIEKACDIGDQCLKDILPIIKEGITEKQIAFKMESWIKEKGCDLAFDPIVAIDVNSAVAHYNTREGEGRVRKGSVILLDYGVKYKDYLSDITRMLFFGKPSDEVAHVYHILLNAQETTVKNIAKVGQLKELDISCRALITDNHLPSYPHSTGHGVGLEIHEYPKVSFNSEDQKREHQIITVEPGVYFPKKWGMRVEDTVVVENMAARILTKYSKSLQII